MRNTTARAGKPSMLTAWRVVRLEARQGKGTQKDGSYERGMYHACVDMYAIRTGSTR